MSSHVPVWRRAAAGLAFVLVLLLAAPILALWGLYMKARRYVFDWRIRRALRKGALTWRAG